MALEEQIVAWSKERPAWQRDVMRRTATGDLLSEDDYDRLVDGIVAPDPGPGGRIRSRAPSEGSSRSPIGSARIHCQDGTRQCSCLHLPAHLRTQRPHHRVWRQRQRQVWLRTTAEADHPGAASRRGSLGRLSRYGDGESHREPYGSYRRLGRGDCVARADRAGIAAHALL